MNSNRVIFTQIDPLGLGLTITGFILVLIDDKDSTIFGIGNIKLEIGMCILSIPLIFKKFLPKKLDAITNIYSIGAITYSLPFLFTYMYLVNPEKRIWEIAMLAAFIILASSIKHRNLWPMIFISCFLAIIARDLSFKELKLPQDMLIVSTAIFFVVLFISYINQRIEHENERKIKLTESIGGIIAHELRTPLASIKLGVSGIQKSMPILLDAYVKAKKANLDIEEINQIHFEALCLAVENIPHTCNKANLSVTTFLKNIHDTKEESLENISIKDAIHDALEAYPMTLEQRKKIRFTLSNDFKFIGNKNMLKHIFINLIKNSLEHLHDRKEDVISIFASSENGCGKIIFEDNGKGIDATELPYIFDKFFSGGTKNGHGIGLFFCKNYIEQLGGEIFCLSKKDSYTKFTIHLPIA